MAHLVHLLHLQHLVHLVHRVLLTTTTSQPRTWRARMVVTMTTLITKLATEDSRPDTNISEVSVQVSTSLVLTTHRIAMTNYQRRLDGFQLINIITMSLTVTNVAVRTSRHHPTHLIMNGGKAYIVWRTELKVEQQRRAVTTMFRGLVSCHPVRQDCNCINTPVLWLACITTTQRTYWTTPTNFTHWVKATFN